MEEREAKKIHNTISKYIGSDLVLYDIQVTIAAKVERKPLALDHLKGV